MSEFTCDKCRRVFNEFVIAGPKPDKPTRRCARCMGRYGKPREKKSPPSKFGLALDGDGR